jgi:hypothetical protein
MHANDACNNKRAIVGIVEKGQQVLRSRIHFSPRQRLWVVYLIRDINMNRLVSTQLDMLEHIKPGQWVPGIRNLRRATRRFECLPKEFDGDVNVAVDKVALAMKSLTCDEVYVSRVNTKTRKIYVRFLTNAKFLDVLTLQVCTQHQADTQGHISIFALSESTCLCPPTIPGAALWGGIFCLFPFGDGGENAFHIQKAKHVLLACKYIARAEDDSEASVDSGKSSRQVVVAPGGVDAAATTVR